MSVCYIHALCPQRSEESREVSGDFLLKGELSPSCLTERLETEKKEEAGNSGVVDLSIWSPVFALKWEGTTGGVAFCPLPRGSASPCQALGPPSWEVWNGILAEGGLERKCVHWLSPACPLIEAVPPSPPAEQFTPRELQRTERGRWRVRGLWPAGILSKAT